MLQPPGRTRALFALSALLFTALIAAGCSSRPKSQPCSNAGDCAAAGSKYGYCADSLCVECLEDSGCGEGNLCVHGMCQRHCKTDVDCKSAGTCDSGTCVSN